MLIKSVFIGFCASVCFACGGSVAPLDDAGREMPPITFGGPTLDEDGGAVEVIDAHAPHFVCHFGQPAVGYVDCTTLADGGPSYTDEGNVDCHVYEEGAGQGCLPPMACYGVFDGVAMTGTCVDEP